MSGTTNDLSKMELICEMLSQQKIEDLSHDKNDVSVCANCGKEGSNLSVCNKCKAVKYCNAACKKKHRSKHKKQCEKIVADLRVLAWLEVGRNEAIFKEPPPQYGDCPICFLRLPSLDNGRRYMECCGKMICSGCFHADVYDNLGNIIADEKCPFCRTPLPTSDNEGAERLKKRMEVGDEYAFALMGNYYDRGECGLPQDSSKAVELWHKAGKFGYNDIGSAYGLGDGVERDEKMACYYHELAAMAGDSYARHNLGGREYEAGNYERALKHYMIAVRGGDTDSVKEIQELYMDGHVAKDEYANALRSHQAYINEIKCDQRDKAAAFHDSYRYY